MIGRDQAPVPVSMDEVEEEEVVEEVVAEETPEPEPEAQPTETPATKAASAADYMKQMKEKLKRYNTTADVPKKFTNRNRKRKSSNNHSVLPEHFQINNVQ